MSKERPLVPVYPAPRKFDAELQALATVLVTLRELEPEARQRVVDYAVRWHRDQSESSRT
jgi:hypothetical protein